MKYVLFAILIFGLPHTNWIPLKLHMFPDQIPLGVLNWIFIFGFLLWSLGKSYGIKRDNDIKYYKIFFLITFVSIIIALLSQAGNLTPTLSLFKNQTLMLLLFYVPLSCLKDEDEFKKVFLIMLVVYTLIGFEVVRSGVLAGANFNDSKRGSGPFSEGLTGSDIAGSYLAQVMMFFCALIFTAGIKSYQRYLSIICTLVILSGVYATYARGALIACIVGLATMLSFMGFKIKYLIIAASVVGMAYMLMPSSVNTRFSNTKTESGEFDESTQGRFFYWENALEVIKENPFGVGIGQVQVAMERKIGKYVDPHNGFLYTACEYGLIGLAVFCLLIVNLLKQSRLVWADPTNPLIYRVYALGMVGMIGAFVTCNIFYANFYKALVMGTIVIHFGMLAFILADIKSKKEIEPI